jgi:hypothetical protein
VATHWGTSIDVAFAKRAMIDHSNYFTIVLFLLLMLSGCSNSNRGVVSGSVTIDGQPVKSGSIAFFPIDEKSPTTGASITDGQYTAQVPLGQTKVQIRVAKKVGEKKLYNTPDSPVQPIMKETLPAKYNDDTELQLDVKPGNTVKNFELTTK